MNETSIKRLLDRTLVATGLRDAAGGPLRYTPHDFRRMFATEAVTGGLPVHIAARILGHETLTPPRHTSPSSRTTRCGPNAVFWTGAGLTGPRWSTASPPSRSGATSSSTSSYARFPLAPVDGPTAHRASTNRPASAALSSGSTPANGAASSRSSRTSANAPAKLAATAGSAKSKAPGQSRPRHCQAQQPQPGPGRRPSPTGRPRHARLHRPTRHCHTPKRLRMHPIHLISFGCPRLPTGPGGRPIPPAADRVEGETTGAGGGRRTWSAARNRGCRPDHSVTVRHSASRSTTSCQARCACRGW